MVLICKNYTHKKITISLQKPSITTSIIYYVSQNEPPQHYESIQKICCFVSIYFDKVIHGNIIDSFIGLMAQFLPELLCSPVLL